MKSRLTIIVLLILCFVVIGALYNCSGRAIDHKPKNTIVSMVGTGVMRKYEDFDIFNMQPVNEIKEGWKNRKYYVEVGYDSRGRINKVKLVDRSISIDQSFQPQYDSLTDSYLWEYSDLIEYGEPVHDYLFIKHGTLYDYSFYNPGDPSYHLICMGKTDKYQSEQWTYESLTAQEPVKVQWNYGASIRTDSSAYEIEKMEWRNDTLIISGAKTERYCMEGRSYIWYHCLHRLYEIK